MEKPNVAFTATDRNVAGAWELQVLAHLMWRPRLCFWSDTQRLARSWGLSPTATRGAWWVQRRSAPGPWTWPLLVCPTGKESLNYERHRGTGNTDILFMDRLSLDMHTPTYERHKKGSKLIPNMPECRNFRSTDYPNWSHYSCDFRMKAFPGSVTLSRNLIHSDDPNCSNKCSLELDSLLDPMDLWELLNDKQPSWGRAVPLTKSNYLRLIITAETVRYCALNWGELCFTRSSK